MFLYADLQWTTGDYYSDGYHGFGGTEALAGYNAGDHINSYTVPGSRTPSVTDIARTSNVGIPGTWIFKVGQGIGHLGPYPIKLDNNITSYIYI